MPLAVSRSMAIILLIPNLMRSGSRSGTQTNSQTTGSTVLACVAGCRKLNHFRNFRNQE